mgnify:FL=1
MLLRKQYFSTIALISLLLGISSVVGVIPLSIANVLSFFLAASGLGMVYNVLGTGNVLLVTLGTTGFLIGLLIFTVNNLPIKFGVFSILMPAAILMIFSINMLMVYIERRDKKNFIFAAIVFFLGAILYSFFVTENTAFYLTSTLLSVVQGYKYLFSSIIVLLFLFALLSNKPGR